MRRKIFSLTLMMLSFSLAFSTCAQPTVTLINKQTTQPVVKEVTAGILPTSFWYWSDIFGEELRFVATLGAKNRADYLMDKAQERTAEVNELATLGIATYNDELFQDKDIKIAHAQKIYEDLGEPIDLDRANPPIDIVPVGDNLQNQTGWTQLTNKIGKTGQNIADIFHNLFAK